jgi:hypothetical protein
MKRTTGFIDFIILFLLIILFQNCEKDPNSTQEIIQTISGFAQKGPFINGSSVTVYDLESNLTSTGKSFNTQIVDDKGTFELSDIKLSSHLIKLRADGFYYNEVLGRQSAAQLTLYALADTKDKTNINVNLLTHLEKSRVEYLIKEGEIFSVAKAQAQTEILAIFNIQKDSILASETLNIFENGDDNGILLAISLLLQGYRSEAELTELVSNISQDLSTDGILNNDTLGSQIINHAIILDTTGIRNNLIQRCNQLGLSPDIPDFEKYIGNFILETKFKITESIIEYPKTGLYGSNILSINDTIYSGYDYSLAANVPERTTLMIKITGMSAGQIWYYSLGSNANWSITQFTGNSQTFTAISSGASCDLHMVEFSPGYYLIEYFESSSSNPTRKKIIRM